MNCVLHYLRNIEDTSNVERNYDILYPSIKDHFLMSFVPNAIPNREFIQLFYKNSNYLSEHQYEHAKFLFLFQINRFLKVKKYKRMCFIGSDTILKYESNIINLMNEINAEKYDFVKFKNDDKCYEDMFLSRISILDSNLDYANCTYENYCSRQRYNNFDVYVNTPFILYKSLEEYVCPM